MHMHREKISGYQNICYLFICLFIYLLVWLHQISVAAHRIFILQHVESGFVTWDRTQTLCMGAQSLSH